MNAGKLADAVRGVAKTVEDNDASELLRVLARMLEGKGIRRAFGAPGDWGYGTPIGDALAAPAPGATVSPPACPECEPPGSPKASPNGAYLVTIPGALVSTMTVERCDSCRRFESDAHAAVHVCSALASWPGLYAACKRLHTIAWSVRPGGGVLVGEREMFDLARSALDCAEGEDR